MTTPTTDTLPWQDGNPHLIHLRDEGLLFGHIFETDQATQAAEFATAIGGEVYTWVASGLWNQLVQGLHLANRLLYVVLPPASIARNEDGTWPDLIDLTDDECEEGDDDCEDAEADE